MQQCKKVGLTVTTGGNQFTVDDAGLCREPRSAAATAGSGA
jgi:hypothetical protein